MLLLLLLLGELQQCERERGVRWRWRCRWRWRWVAGNHLPRPASNYLFLCRFCMPAVAAVEQPPLPPLPSPSSTPSPLPSSLLRHRPLVQAMRHPLKHKSKQRAWPSAVRASATAFRTCAHCVRLARTHYTPAEWFTVFEYPYTRALASTRTPLWQSPKGSVKRESNVAHSSTPAARSVPG